ncbi:response regulator [Xanthomarina gelatinilytica]|jgi:DNA-binding NarL/FixJ family response regulator|uniref:response regulator n=1 Tax=Flavobacteriaceae TaxID=49546 RepID=UPI003AA93B1C
MKTKGINILMIDDHPMILKSYVDVLKDMERASERYRFSIDHAHSTEEAYLFLNMLKGKQLHLIFLDLGLPNNIKYSGLHLGGDIRMGFPEVKIIIITSYDSFPLIQQALSTVKPDGLLIKGELNPDSLKIAVNDVLEGIPHYTKTVRKYLTHKEKTPPLLDHYDLLLLYHLSEGKQTKELPAVLHLSITSVERRKRRLKEILKLEAGSTDVQLLNRAKEEGLL